MIQNVKTIVWDLDNTLYKATDDVGNAWHHAAATYAVEHADMSYDDAYQQSCIDWKKHHNAWHFLSAEKNLCPKAVHEGVNAKINVKGITPCLQTPTLFKEMKSYRHIILTYAMSDYALRMLDHIQLKDYFEPHDVFGANHYNFEDKAKGSQGISLALEKSQTTPEQAMFVEDTLINLKPAKDKGVKTVYLHHDRPINQADTAFVDLIVKDTPELLRYMATLNKAA